jgi:hypothetical protein
MYKFKAHWLLAFIVLFALSCQKEIKTNSKNSVVSSNSEACGDPLVKTLIDQGGVLTMGSVSISNDGTDINIQVDAAAGQVITRIAYVAGSNSHVSDGMTLPNIFYTACEGPGTPDEVLTFSIASNTTSHTISLPESAFQEDGCVWIGLLVSTNNSDGTAELCGGVDEFDEMFGSAGYQSGFKYCRQDCPPPPDCGQLRTQTPGGWGAAPNGNNTGAYLKANFDAAFGDFITVGCYPDNFYVKLTSAAAIEALLPTGGTAKVLTANATDPASMQNVLVGHLVAVTLAVGFDNFDPNFGQAGVHLGQMEIGSGAFAGWTVSAFLQEANKILGGCSTSHSIQDVLTTATAINENYVDGNTDNGFLVCPEE